jgi:hypothetical protein
MLKKIIKHVNESEEKKQWGMGTIVLKSMEDFDKIFDEFKEGMVSPGGAAGMLGVSRAYIHQLEKEGKIRAYRIWNEDVDWDKLPLKWRLFVKVKDVYIYIPVEDLQKVKKEMIKKAKDKLKRLERK